MLLRYLDRKIFQLTFNDNRDMFLQRQIAQMMMDFVSEKEAQIITASHSPDFLSEIPSSQLVWIDRNEREARQCNNIGSMLVDLGAITNTDAIRAHGADKILFVEGGLDRKLFRHIFELSGNSHNPFEDTKVIVAELPNGKGDKKHLKTFCELLRSTYAIQAKIACIVDSDYARVYWFSLKWTKTFYA
jgi:predicted ATP-dependent endonuclease of OLD family